MLITACSIWTDRTDHNINSLLQEWFTTGGVRFLRHLSECKKLLLCATETSLKEKKWNFLEQLRVSLVSPEEKTCEHSTLRIKHNSWSTGCVLWWRENAVFSCFMHIWIVSTRSRWYIFTFKVKSCLWYKLGRLRLSFFAINYFLCGMCLFGW